MSAGEVARSSNSAQMLVVTEQLDDAARRLAIACERRGWIVRHVTDVFTAMALLAAGRERFAGMAIDARGLDACESRFLDIVKSQYSDLSIHSLNDADSAPQAPETTGPFRPAAPAESTGVVSRQADAAPEQNSSVTASFVAESAVAAEAAPCTISLHEAVRRRMIAGAQGEHGGPSRVQRIPPGAAAPPTLSPLDAQSSAEAALSREELEALLDPQSPLDEP